MTSSRIASIAQSHIYKYMKMNNIKVHQYAYQLFFQYITEKFNILVMEQQLHNDIAGLSITDKQGHVSISYEKRHHTHRQNFTKCHELGHFLLKHEGKIFTSTKTADSLVEIEANIFAGYVLAPDIVLFGKIVKEEKSFQEIIKDLGISAEALKIRLKQLLINKSKLTINEIDTIILHYISHKNNDLKAVLKQLSHILIQDFKNVEINPLDHLEYLLKSNNIVTSLQIPQLLEESFRNTLKNNLSTSWKFGRGIEFYYVWDNQKLSTEQAQKLAKDVWFRLAY